MPTIEQLRELPLLYTTTVPEEFLDQYGHMNVRYYAELWGRAAGPFMKSLGCDFESGADTGIGYWLLKQVLEYLAEVRVGDTITIHGIICGRTNKMLHNKFWMINETQGRIAATSEVLSGRADLNARRLDNFPEELGAAIDEKIDYYAGLDLDPQPSNLLLAPR